MKKILIDANPTVPYFASGKISGIGRTCMELIAQLNKMKSSLPFEIELLTQNLKGIKASLLDTGFKARHIYLRNTEIGCRWSYNLHLREFISGYDLQHITHNYELVRDPGKCIVTLHDVMFYSYPEPCFNPEAYKTKVTPFARKARHIITISENSKREIMQYMDIPKEKITVIPWGVDHMLYYPHKPESNPYCGESPYFIAVSCSDGRKNTISSIRAFEKFARQHPAHHFIIVWRNPSEEALKIAALPHVKDRIHFVSHLSNYDLAELYAGATASFFPSLYEGFGLPILESMACGVPCITARNSSLVEVGGDAAIYVHPLDSDALAAEMEKFENFQYDMAQIKEDSIKQAAKFTWDKCAMATVEVYKKCLS